jgi:predicted nucleic acid-binding protein
MAGLKYILDTNAVADYINQFEPTRTRIRQALRDRETLYLCPPVEYEVLRGLIRTNAPHKRKAFEQTFAPQLTPLPLIADDWKQAAQFWAAMRKRGRQISDVDVLLAALANRLDATIVSDDSDFDALPVQRENWREI